MADWLAGRAVMRPCQHAEAFDLLAADTKDCAALSIRLPACMHGVWPWLSTASKSYDSESGEHHVLGLYQLRRSAYPSTARSQNMCVQATGPCACMLQLIACVIQEGGAPQGEAIQSRGG